MNLDDLNSFIYIKRPMNEVFPKASLVPPEYLMDWLKDTYDYRRTYTDEELKRFLELTPEDILQWLEEAAAFVWETKRHLTAKPLEVHRDG